MRLAHSVGRLDWQNLAKELTPYELQVWMAFEAVEPFGERRADLRAAVHSLVMIQKDREQPLSEMAVSKIIDALTNYIGDNEEEEISPEQAVRRLNTTKAI